MGEPAILPFDWADPFDLNHQLTDEERMVRDTAEAYAQEKLQPRVTEAYLNENFDREILREMGELGLLGATIPPEYGGAGLGYVSYGLIARAVERVDSGYRSAMSVQSSLVMYPINAYGSRGAAEEISARPRHRRIGRLLRPDRARRRLRSRRHAHPRRRRSTDGYKLTGTKMWITNSPIADVFVVWAKSEAHGGTIRGFVLEKGMKGLSAPKIKEKLSLRASITGEIVMDEVEVGEDALLPNVQGLKGPFGCLNRARYGIGWGSMGAAEACYAAARQYTLDRKQFGRPLAANQLVQLKLANMVDRDHARPAGGAARRPPARGGRADPRGDQPDQAQQLRQGARHRPDRPRHARRQRHLAPSSRSCATPPTSRRSTPMRARTTSMR